MMYFRNWRLAVYSGLMTVRTPSCGFMLCRVLTHWLFVAVVYVVVYVRLLFELVRRPKRHAARIPLQLHVPHTQDTPLVVILFTDTVLRHSQSKVSAVWVSYSTCWWWMSVLVEGFRSGGQCAAMRAIPGLTKEKFLNMVWSTLLMSVRSAHDSRGFSFINSLSKLLQSLGDVCKNSRAYFHTRDDTVSVPLSVQNVWADSADRKLISIC